MCSFDFLGSVSVALLLLFENLSPHISYHHHQYHHHRQSCSKKLINQRNIKLVQQRLRSFRADFFFFCPRMRRLTDLCRPPNPAQIVRWVSTTKIAASAGIKQFKILRVKKVGKLIENPQALLDWYKNVWIELFPLFFCVYDLSACILIHPFAHNLFSTALLVCTSFDLFYALKSR